ncbi:hypothetical protein ZWY2020_034032 [Hordeum vulgare]|nr:hypothetical protein ZWY2020_034032 [Hordeum vulgare]
MADDEADLRMDDDECPVVDGSFSTRFSTTRLRQIADRLPKKKKDVIRLCSFGSLLNINSFSVPTDLLDWVVMKIDREKSLFSHKQKSILFTKDMVRKIFNVTSGSRAVELLRRNEPHVLGEPYRVGSRAPTGRTIEVLEVANVLDVVTIKRAWVLLCIALVLSPGTGNMVPLEYLASLVDMDSISEFAWDEHFLAVALNEIPRHMIPIYEKHKKLHATEVKKVLKSFGQVLEAMFCKRLTSILVEANATATSSNHHKPEDVTFHAPAGNAANAGHTRAPIHTSPEAHKSPTPQEVDAYKEVAGCSNTKQNEAQWDIGLEKMQSCCFPGTEDVQQGPILGEREKLVGAEVGGGVI